ncbi:MAG: 16S rRNA (cytosine(1402)-N(4))-methyltransferase [Bacillota bacterium]|nr:MAG: 16S rRNA (cytosine(1402)-N(4))-methyltransferase [Bacillota bacterium]
MEELKHYSVMREECIDGLNLKENGVYFDGTLGGAGHSCEILKRAPKSTLYATDLDDYGIERAKDRLKEFQGRFTIYHDNFKNFPAIAEREGIELDGVLLDLGMSSFQIDDKARGFSYLSVDEPLDMRMDKRSPLSAKEVVNGYTERELERILKTYGEEKFAAKIAKNIVAAKAANPIERCGELVKIIEQSIPAKFRYEGGHPAKRTFQAIRIEVNGELSGLYEAVISLTRLLKKGGRIAVLTFHSLEDRAVKSAFKELETDCVCDKSLPVCVCGRKREIKLITKHPVTAGEEELKENSRSKSAKLRIAEKL